MRVLNPKYSVRLVVLAQKVFLKILCVLGKVLFDNMFVLMAWSSCAVAPPSCPMCGLTLREECEFGPVLGWSSGGVGVDGCVDLGSRVVWEPRPAVQ